MLALICTVSLEAQAFRAPAGMRQAQRHATGAILPGGRIIQPVGDQFITGSGPFGLAISPDGKTILTANGGPGRNSITIIQRDKTNHWDVRHMLAHTKGDAGENDEDPDWRSVFMGIAFVNEHSAWVSEGNSGKIALFDWNALSNNRRRTIDLNQKGYDDSYTGNLAHDAERGILYVVDQANFRIAVVDTKSRQVLA